MQAWYTSMWIVERIAWPSPRQSHWDKHTSTRPGRTQRHRGRRPPEWGCASWRPSCLARAPSTRCQCWTSSDAPWSRRTSLGCCSQTDSWVQWQELWWIFMIVYLPVFPPKSCLKCLEEVERRRRKPLLMEAITFLASESFKIFVGGSHNLCNLWELRMHPLSKFTHFPGIRIISFKTTTGKARGSHLWVSTILAQHIDEHGKQESDVFLF